MEKYLKIALEAAYKARHIHMAYYKKILKIQNKQDSSLVSNADQESEQCLRDIFHQETPDFSILGEEQGLTQKNSNGRWVFDPLDGTTNYIHGYPFFCSSIALQMNGEVVLGVVDSGIFNKTYYAIKNGGAFCQTPEGVVKLQVSSALDLKQSLIATGFMTYGGEDLDRQVAIFSKLIQTSRGVRRSGSAALELCLVAEGCLDGFWEFGLKEWDTSAGSLIIQEAGGIVTNLEAQSFLPHHSAIIAGTPKVQRELLDSIKT